MDILDRILSSKKSIILALVLIPFTVWVVFQGLSWLNSNYAAQSQITEVKAKQEEFTSTQKDLQEDLKELKAIRSKQEELEKKVDLILKRMAKGRLEALIEETEDKIYEMQNGPLIQSWARREQGKEMGPSDKRRLDKLKSRLERYKQELSHTLDTSY